MKHAGKLFTFLLALVLVPSLCFTAPIPALGDDGGETGNSGGTGVGTITIKNAEKVTVENKTFKAYKILDLTMSGQSDENGKPESYAYTVPEGLKQFYKTRYSLNPDSSTFDIDVKTHIAAETDVHGFTLAVLQAAKDANIEPITATGTSGAKSVVMNNVPLGYYIIEDVIEDEGNTSPISALMMGSVDPDLEVVLKADQPDIQKYIDGAKDTDPATPGYFDMNNAAIGDKIPYVLLSRVPVMKGYEKFFFVVNDTLSKGLTFNDDVVIKVGSGDNIRTLTSGTDYFVTSAPVEDGTAVKIVFNDFRHKFQNDINEKIEITYSATLNSNAQIGKEGNANEVTLTYSTDPKVIPSGENEPQGNDPIGITPPKRTKTFVTGVEITKVDNHGHRLAGAQFKLEGERLNAVLVEQDSYELNNDSGTHWKLKDGSYTTTAPTTDTEGQYASTTDKYSKTTQTQTIEKSETVSYEGTVGADGILRFGGIAAGSYTLTELIAPDGYNLLAQPIELTIVCSPPETIEGDCIWRIALSEGTGTISDGGIIELTIQNNPGTLLPETGGIGTTVLYIIGGILVLGAAIALIARKRMSSNSKH